MPLPLYNRKGVSVRVLLSCLLLLAITVGADDDVSKKLVCYYANWSIYRPGLAKFTPENIDPFLCTHLIYAFAGMNKNYELKPFDSYNDLQLGNYKKFTNLKNYNRKLKVMIAVGGWNEGSKRFSKMVESTSSRQSFVRGALSFLRKHGFDGLDLDWEYPGSRDGGREQDKEGYANLVQELREAFDAESVPSGRSRLLLSMAVPAGKEYIDRGYDLIKLNRYLDFFNLLTYDYHTSQEAQVYHHAPLGEEPGLEEWSPNKQLHVTWTVDYYLDKGCDSNKLILGIPTYGRSFTLADPDETDPGAPAAGPGEKGLATREAGYLAYHEICQLIQDEEWELEAPHPEIVGPHAYKADQWVGFDDEDIIVEKVKFIKRKKLGGGMVWTLDNDDFRGKCYGEQSPLVATLKSALRKTEEKLSDSKPGTPSSTTTTTTAAPKAVVFTTPDPDTPFECEDEGFFPHPSDCKKYFWCLDGGAAADLVAHAFTCPSGLHFNKQRDACDYAGNVVCRAKKRTTTVSTTAKPRPRPRTRKTTTKKTTTTATTTTTTTTPSPKDSNDLSLLKGESLADILNLLQQLGINQIQDRLQAGNSNATLALQTYKSPNRRRTDVTTTPAAELFLQYAQPDRSLTPRGPQFQALPDSVMGANPITDSADEEEAKSIGSPPSSGGGDFPFVYHTPSRQRSKTTPEKDENEVSTTTMSSTTRSVVVRVRPIPGEGRNKYVLAQTVGVRQRVRPNVLDEEKTTVAAQTRPPRRKELIVLQTGKAAVPATTRRYHVPAPAVRGPALALLPDGGITCLRRGVHPHPGDCTKFIVCVPSDKGEDLDGFIHDCPLNTQFLEDKGRCMPGSGQQTCSGKDQ